MLHHIISRDMIAAADAAAETCETNGKPKLFQKFDFEKRHSKQTYHETRSAMKLCIANSSDDFLFFLDHVYDPFRFQFNLITCYETILFHSILYDIISYDIISYDMISYDMISCDTWVPRVFGPRGARTLGGSPPASQPAKNKTLYGKMYSG